HRPEDFGADQRSERDTDIHNFLPDTELLTQSLEQRRYMHLVGLVVAGKRVHHDVHAGAEGEFALAWLAVDHRQYRLAVLARRPRPAKIVGGYDDGGHAVPAARRSPGSFLLAF